MTGTNHVLLLSCLLSRLTSLFGDPASGHQQWSLWGTCPSSHASTWECTPNATIHQIQGIRQYSPLAGEFVAVAGIVTGIVDHSGFYMQVLPTSPHGHGLPSHADINDVILSSLK